MANWIVKAVDRAYARKIAKLNRNYTNDIYTTEYIRALADATGEYEVGLRALRAIS